MPSCAICNKASDSGQVVHTDCLKGVMNYNDAESEIIRNTLDRNKELLEENKRLQGAFDDAGLTTEETIEMLDAVTEGRLGILPCRPGEVAYYAYNTVENEEWTYAKCRMVAANAEEYIIECEYKREGEKYSAMRKWLYVFATEPEASDFVQRKNAERTWIPTGNSSPHI